MIDSPEFAEQWETCDLQVTAEHQHVIDCITQVCESNKFNKDGCKIEVSTKWNIPLLNTLLEGYHDQGIVELLQYGFPIDRNNEVLLEMGGINHRGATLHQQHVDNYLRKELKEGAMIGPFENIPFKSCPVAISPLST